MKTIFGVVLLLFGGWVQAASLPDFTDLIAETSPSVVKINTVSSVNGANDLSLENVPPLFRDYFDRQQGPQRRASSIGSGFIISADGYIVTNHHVIAGASEITVRLLDRSEYIAEVVGTDERSDVALLKIAANRLPVLKFADADATEVGDWVLSIGSPYDMEYSASAGIVSAMGRSLPNGSGQDYVPFIQTDVAINPGNSGGPLFNLKGEVVGINAQIVSQSGGFMGLSFAIPVSVATDVIQQLRTRGTVERGWLGVAIQDVDISLAQSFGLDKPEGALITRVLSDSPAEAAGFQSGDIVLEFDGKDIEYSHDLPHVVGLIAPNTKVKARVFRERRERTIKVRVGGLLNDNQPRAIPASITRQSTGGVLGLTLQRIDDAELTALRINGGVKVADVVAGSPARRAGLMAGDVIVQLDFEDISSVKGFRDVVDGLRGGSVVPILFYRNGSSIFRTIEVDG